jgi:hypothetical protein
MEDKEAGGCRKAPCREEMNCLDAWLGRSTGRLGWETVPAAAIYSISCFSILGAHIGHIGRRPLWCMVPLGNCFIL